MDTPRLKRFAQYARRSLIEQVKSKLKLVLAADSAARRETPPAVKALEAKQKQLGNDELLVEQVAYTWFNRFCALRFMDVNQYNRIMVVSPIAGQFQPEILAEAKAGHLDDAVFNAKTSEQINALLAGTTPSRDGQAEAYRLIVVRVCNNYHRLMPYLFERIEDYTELLMPDDLLSGNSILAYTREAMTPENCESVESIGWLYQFYISEKKDKIFEGLKKNIKITPENIPAATQLFTPHWIVKYLVENSLGRLWMLNNPNSKVIEQMAYYIAPVEEGAPAAKEGAPAAKEGAPAAKEGAPAAKEGKEQPVEEEDFLRVTSPEELKVCDPACGSGHMLIYAYDLLYAIYLDANYDPVDIPALILTKNLYGIDIDERATTLAAFALSMKAIKGNPLDDSNNRRRFFRDPIKPNICRLEKVKIDQDALEEYIAFAGADLFTPDVLKTLTEFEEADNFGSLIQPTLQNPAQLLAKLEVKDAPVELFLKDTHESVLRILKQAEYLSPVYHVVIANPPYMGTKGMNARLVKWAKDNYPDSKTDLFAMFIERDLALIVENGFSAMINMQSWMFLSSFEKLRKKILLQTIITSMANLGTRAFDSIGGEVVSTTAYVLQNKSNQSFKGCFVRLVDGKSESEKASALLEAIQNPNCGWFYRASANDFGKISGKPIAYWLSDKVFDIFESASSLGEFSKPMIGMRTGDNDKYMRRWFEVDNRNSNYHSVSALEGQQSKKRWFPYQKGGEFRRWFGNMDFVVNWYDDGFEIKDNTLKNYPQLSLDNLGWKISNEKYYYKRGITWTATSSSYFGVRLAEKGCLFDVKGSFLIPNSDETNLFLGLMCSKFTQEIVKVLNPTIEIQPRDVASIPFDKGCLQSNKEKIDTIVSRLIEIAQIDWNSYERSWEFTESILLKFKGGKYKLKDTYNTVRAVWSSYTEEAQKLEIQNNISIIEAYKLEGEFVSEVSLNEVTLTCNPNYRYPDTVKRTYTDEERERELLADTLNEFISYSCGCMFGRYSLDKEGLILANQGDTVEDYLAKIPSPTFMPDDDNVIPIIDFEGNWFEDDIAERFKQFLKVTFGEDNFAENLAFVEEAIGKDINKYFVKDFYADHVKRYKKRPIYWMFSSPKGSFNALIYMHRYHSGTVSIVLNDYLREFRTKLAARKDSYEQVEISASASQKDKTQAIKSIAKINIVLEEVNDYEHDVLYPLAGEKIDIDLDDGVKHNYPRFGKALKKVTGLS